jgi:multidrug efflux pump subunit AcrA (membrane-fusion protein)
MRTILTSLVILGVLVSCSEKAEKTTPIQKDLTISVYASAQVLPKDYYLVYPSTPGILEEWFVQVGDTVKRGQLLGQIKNDNSELQVESAELNSNLASEKYLGQANLLKSIKTEIAATQKQLRLDSINFSRQAKLWSNKVGTLADYESSKLRYELSRNRLVNLEQRLHQSQIELKNAYLQAEKSLNLAVSQLGDFGIKSIMDGKIYDIRSNEGELVSLQQPIAAIGKQNEFIVEMWVDEQDIAQIRVGQEFVISLDAYPNTAYQGTISHLYPTKDERTQSFKIEGQFTNRPDELFAGLSGESNIILKQKKNVLVIPQSYLLTDSTVLTNNGEVGIITGEGNLSDIEVISGITEETILVAPPVQ